MDCYYLKYNVLVISKCYHYRVLDSVCEWKQNIQYSNIKNHTWRNRETLVIIRLMIYVYVLQCLNIQETSTGYDKDKHDFLLHQLDLYIALCKVSWVNNCWWFMLKCEYEKCLRLHVISRCTLFVSWWKSRWKKSIVICVKYYVNEEFVSNNICTCLTMHFYLEYSWLSSPSQLLIYLKRNPI